MDCLPRIRLSLGQLAWTLNQGRPPEARLRNEIRYLRQLGVPHAEHAAGEGRGHRIFYGFDELIELGVALYAMRHGMKPQDAAAVLVGQRADFRKFYRDAWLQQPKAALGEDWVKSRGRIISMLANEIFLRLHDRYSTKPGTYEIVTPAQGLDLAALLGMREVFPDRESRPLVPLTKLVLEGVYWAQQAPEVRPGRPQ